MLKLVSPAVLFILFAFGCQAQETVLLDEKGVENAYPRLAADGKSILYQSNKTGNWQLYVYDIDSKNSVRITNDSFNNNFPDWSPDNKTVCFVSDRDGNEEIYTININGTGIKRITADTSRDIHPYFSPDGNSLLFNSTRGNQSLDIYRVNLTDQKTERLTDTPDEETCARYSPDMKKIVFLRNNYAIDDVFVLDLETGLSTNITNTPLVTDGWPMFDQTGSLIYYSSRETGNYCIYKINADGKNKKQVTKAPQYELHERVFISNSKEIIIYNKRTRTGISICAIPVEK